MIHSILFDAVGTLLRVEPSVAAIYHRVARNYGSRLTADMIAERFSAVFEKHHAAEETSESIERQRWERIVTDVLDDLPSVEARAAFEELWHLFERPEQWRLFPDVQPTWEELLARGYELGIASNFDERLLALCGQLPPLDSAKQIFVSSQIGFIKPSRSFFDRVAERLHREPHEILLVGDSEKHDLLGARAAGWNAVLIDRSQSSPSPRAITTLRDLLDRL